MDSGKFPIGEEIHLAVPNPLYGKTKCKCCGHKLKKQPRYIYQEGYFIGILAEDDVLHHYAEYRNEDWKLIKEPIGRHWMGDIIDSPIFDNTRISQFDYYSKDIDIFEYGYEWDGAYAFRTKQEALDWIEEFGDDEEC